MGQQHGTGPVRSQISNTISISECFPIEEVGRDLALLKVPEKEIQAVCEVLQGAKPANRVLVGEVLDKAQAHYEYDDYKQRNSGQKHDESFIRIDTNLDLRQSPHSVDWRELITALPELLARATPPIPALISYEVLTTDFWKLDLESEGKNPWLLLDEGGQRIEMYLTLRVLSYLENATHIDDEIRDELVALYQERRILVLGDLFPCEEESTAGDIDSFLELVNAETTEGAMKSNVVNLLRDHIELRAKYNGYENTRYLHPRKFLLRLERGASPVEGGPGKEDSSKEELHQFIYNVSEVLMPRREEILTFTNPLSGILSDLKAREDLTHIWFTTPGIDEIADLGFYDELDSTPFDLRELHPDVQSRLFAKNLIEQVCQEGGIKRILIAPGYLYSDGLIAYLRDVTGICTQDCKVTIREYFEQDRHTPFTTFLASNYRFSEQDAPPLVARQIAMIDDLHPNAIGKPVTVNHLYTVDRLDHKGRILMLGPTSKWPMMRVKERSVYHIRHGVFSENDKRTEALLRSRDEWDGSEIMGYYDQILRIFHAGADRRFRRDEKYQLLQIPNDTVGSRLAGNKQLAALHADDLREHHGEMDGYNLSLSDFQVTTLNNDLGFLDNSESI